MEPFKNGFHIKFYAMKILFHSIFYLCLLFSHSAFSQEKPCTVDPTKMMNSEENEVVIIDVRTPPEYNDGHVKDALLINVNSRDFQEEVGKLDREKQYYVYCRSGMRSARAQSLMQNLGFTKVCNVEGGILRMKEEGIPLVE